MSKKLSCDVCLKTFARRSHLLRHKQAHGGAKYNCTLCNKSFSQNTSLKTNSRIHSWEKPYNFLHSSKSFNQKSVNQLPYSQRRETAQVRLFMQWSFIPQNTYEKAHWGKNYNCNQCEFKTAHSSSLKMHKREHTGENCTTASNVNPNWQNQETCKCSGIHTMVKTKGDAQYSCIRSPDSGLVNWKPYNRI